MRFACLAPVVLLGLLILGVLFGLISHVSPWKILTTLKNPETLFALRLTLATSGAATLLATLLGVPAGYYLARYPFRGKVLVDTLIDLPMTLTPLVVGVGLLFLLGNDLVAGATRTLGIQLLFTPLGAVLAQTFIAAPIMTRAGKSAFAAVDCRYEKAAQTLGLRPWQVFVRISLPIALPMILSGVVLSWARTVGEFGATLMVAGATRFRTETLPIAVYLNISSGELGIALACAWLLILTGFLVLLLLKWIGSPLVAGNPAAARMGI
jgi:molybdate transport system permease protein